MAFFTWAFQGIHGEENTQKRRAHRKVQGATRAVGSVTLEAILAKRNQKPEFRKAQRDAAVKAAKEVNKATKEAKKVASKSAAKVRSEIFLVLRVIRADLTSTIVRSVSNIRYSA